VDLRDGHIQLGEGIVAGPSLSEADFLALALTTTPLIHNGAHRSYLTPPVILEGRCYRPSLYFSDGKVTFVSLTWDDPSTRALDPWEGYSPAREKEIARADASWVSSVLHGVGSMTATYTFPWGTISSGFDERSGFSSVVVRYR
jgi:hypothetical protein